MSLNPQQLAAVRVGDGPLLILAGAGTGKTRTLTHRIAHLIRRRGVPPAGILALTFTNRAGREMKARLGALLDGATAELLFAGTFHSFCLRLLRRWPAEVGLRPGFTICGEREQLDHLEAVLARSAVSGGERARPRDVLALLSRAKSRSVTERDAPPDERLASLLRRYDEHLRAANSVDFDDLIGLAVQLLARHPAAREHSHAQYRHVLVDEYQDTNRAQFELIRLLVGPRRNICVVGDDDQSIYGWRGAEVANILEFERHFPDCRVIRLEQNYRSTGRILAAANAVIRHNTRRHAKELWSNLPEGEPIRLVTAADDLAEAAWVVNDLHQRHCGQGARYQDFAIAYRTNSQSRAFEVDLRARRIPYRVVGGMEFYERREVRDLLAFLKVLVNPDDEASLLRVLNLPPRGLGPSRLAALDTALADRPNLFARLADAAQVGALPRPCREAASRFHRAVALAAPRIVPRPDGRAIRAFLEGLGYPDYLRSLCRDGDEQFERISNLDELLGTIDRFAALNPQADLGDYLAEQALLTDADRELERDEAADGVTLITLHSCKGLEFPHLYLAGIENGLLPHRHSEASESLAEERRLFYVGLTRAQSSLCLSYAATRRKYGVAVPCQPSPFLAEIPPALLTAVDAAAARPVSAEQAADYFAQMREVSRR